MYVKSLGPAPGEFTLTDQQKSGKIYNIQIVFPHTGFKLGP